MDSNHASNIVMVDIDDAILASSGLLDAYAQVVAYESGKSLFCLTPPREATAGYLAATCPVVVAPAMNHRMWAHVRVQANLFC